MRKFYTSIKIARYRFNGASIFRHVSVYVYIGIYKLDAGAIVLVRVMLVVMNID